MLWKMRCERPADPSAVNWTRIHGAAQMSARYLAEQINETETVYPDTNLRLVYKLVSD